MADEPLGPAAAAETGEAAGAGEEDAPAEGLQSLARGLAVVRALAAAGEPRTLAQVAQAAGLNRAVTRRVLLTLVEVGYVLARGREFSLRPRVLELGQAYRSSLRLPALGEAAMAELVATTGQSCSMAVLDGDEIVYVQRVPGSRIIDAVIHVGTRLPAHATAMGRVLLAALDDTALEPALGPGRLAGLTERTVTDPDALRAELARVRERGYSLIEQEFERGLTTLAAPVRDAAGAVVAAVNLPLSSYTLPDGKVPEEYVDALLATAQKITDAAVATGLRS
ncbi:IclR family transcriptional regulator domain-containing protein [Georgenia thermotolerans]|uniref:Helix-turn-helix domain-containing protein n=1 Tax=Georgenia thermotolerans TaxID=527326 RepID=A0A7J5USI2_9MICO|nr:IclR family transcriptional regulator C-terminal domain-containing protein [Georgenia thermotolerans]KAE8765415.1 helix-turn-helix domain-containing protein [Georgenia thermotolerans]